MTDYEKLNDICTEIDVLISHHVLNSTPEFQTWHLNVRRFLANRYGKDSIEYNEFEKIHFQMTLYTPSTPTSSFVEKCKKGLLVAKGMLKTYLQEMEQEAIVKKDEVVFKDKSKVFIVHGHDGELKSEVARLIEKQGLSAIILSEKTNAGKTIIEKFEKHSDVGAAVLLFTADDVGKAKNGSELASRARQNVVLEAGYFMAKLGRENTIIIYEDGVELPSDIMGMVYTNKSNWKVDLLKELRNIGYNIDFNLLYSE